MSTLGAAKFKQECLAILDRLGPEGIVITKHGKPVAKLVPIQTESAALIGSLAGKIRVHGDLLTTGLRWDATQKRSLAPRRRPATGRHLGSGTMEPTPQVPKTA